LGLEEYKVTLTKEEKKFCIWYRKLLREMKRAGLTIEDMPPHIAESALQVHQYALLIERKRRLE
jgi:hypothetical protein